MNFKYLKQTVITIVLPISLNFFSFSFLSEAVASEFSKPTPVTSSEETVNALNLAIQNNSSNFNDQKSKNNNIPFIKPKGALQQSTSCNNRLQPYIDAHRKFWAS